MSFNNIKLSAILLILSSTVNAQQARVQPTWWFGASAAANFNKYEGTTQMLNSNTSTATAFHKGDGVKPYISVLTEYRPNNRWGGMLNLAYDNRSGDFNEVMAPCNCPANLSTKLTYITLEPSLRFAPLANSFYIFAGPTISFNSSKSFLYTQEKQTDKKGDFDNIRKTVISAQAGMGIDIPVSAASKTTQTTISPFVSLQTNMGRDPRSDDSWSLYTVRAGVALKFGKTAGKAVAVDVAPAVITEEGEVRFAVRAPVVVAVNRRVKETLPFRNSVFFNMGSASIPDRYIQLSKTDAVKFNEASLQEKQPNNLTNGRSARQLAVYHNILNIMGDRLRSNPSSSIRLTGSSDKNPAEGKQMAENIKQYLVNVYGINGSRIITEGRDKPVVPSEHPGATQDIALLKEGDRRVDIESSSPELLLQVGGSASPFLKPVQINAVQTDPLDSHVIFSISGATEIVKNWTVEVKDESGKIQHYGPYTATQVSIPATKILGSNDQGKYNIEMKGTTVAGKTLSEKAVLNLVKVNDVKQEGLRYSILFDFDESKSLSKYEKFLTEVVTPLIPENATVIIHGHTDKIGDDKHNQTLSLERATGTQQVIQRALTARGTKGVKFETSGHGEDESFSPFENNLPEERFYNRTVIIDIVPAN